MVRWKKNFWFKAVSWVVLVTFSYNVLAADYFQINKTPNIDTGIPSPGSLLTTSRPFSPPVLKALSVNADDPFKINFLVDPGDCRQADSEQINLMAQYFLTFLTIPEEDLWVNLSPHESDRIIDFDLEPTAVGRDMLITDYLLKQLTASLTFPERQIGKTFWNKIYKKAYQLYGTTNIPINTFNKVWIVPEKAVVRENKDSAFIYESKLKVLMEDDYLALKNNSGSGGTPAGLRREETYNLSAQVAREVIIPELEREVNRGKHFARLRQMFHALILATWFKRRIKKHLVNEVYSDKKKIFGISIQGKDLTKKIYSQYIEAYKRGAYNYIRRDYDRQLRQAIRRRYYSGGFYFGDSRSWFVNQPDKNDVIELAKKVCSKLHSFVVNLIPIGLSRQALLTAGDSQIADFDQILASVVNGRHHLSDSEIKDSIIDKITILYKAGKKNLIRERILAYQKLLEPGGLIQYTTAESRLQEFKRNLTDEQLIAVSELLGLLEVQYTALEPLEAVEELNFVPLKVTVETGLNEDITRKIALKIISAKEVAESALKGLFWKYDAIFSPPIPTRITYQLYNDPQRNLEYNSRSGDIEIGENTWGDSQEEFNLKLQEAILQAQLHRITSFLEKEIGQEKAEELRDKISAMADKGVSFIDLLLFFNVKDRFDFDEVNEFLSLLLEQKGELSYDAIVERLEPSEKLNENPGSKSVFERFVRYLRKHPNLVRVSLGIILLLCQYEQASADVFDNTTIEPSVTNVEVISTNLPERHLVDSKTYSFEQSLTDDETFVAAEEVSSFSDTTADKLTYSDILSFGSRGEEVKRAGTALLNQVNADDIRDLKGNVNELNDFKPYDGDYLFRNAQKIVEGAEEDIRQGFFSRNVERTVIAFQEKYDLSEDGDIGRQVIDKLNDLQGVQEAAKTFVQADGKIQLKELEAESQSEEQEINIVSAAGPGGNGDDKVVQPPETSNNGRVQAEQLRDKSEMSPVSGVAPISVAADDSRVEAPDEAKQQIDGDDAVISFSTHATPLRETMFSYVRGIVSGLNPHKYHYAQNEEMYILENPDAIGEQKSLNAKLNNLMELQRGELTAYEMNVLNQQINDLQILLAKVKRKYPVIKVRAPFDCTVANFRITNGREVIPGMPVLDYNNEEILQLKGSVQSSVTEIGGLSEFTVNRRQVLKIAHAGWRSIPAQDSAEITFNVVPQQKIPAGEKVEVEFKIAVLGDPDNNLAVVQEIDSDIAPVSHAEEIDESSPAKGPVRFFADIGDKVFAGQVLAEVDPSPYWEEYLCLIRAYNTKQEQLNRIAPDLEGTNHFRSSQISKLKAESESLFEQILNLQSAIARLQIRATHDGVISYRAPATVFSEKDVLLRVKTSKVFIGDVDHPERAVILTGGVSMGDPVIVKTLTQQYLPGRVTAFNRNISSTQRILGGIYSGGINSGDVTAVQVTVFDDDYSLGRNLPVEVVIPSPGEKEDVLRQLKAAEERYAQNSLQRAVYQKPLIELKPVEDKFIPGEYQTTEDTVVLPYDNPISFVDIVDDVAGNNLFTGPLRLEVLQRQAAERLSQRKLLSLMGNVYLDSSGNVSFGGGLGLSINEVMMSAQSGDAIGAALPIVFKITTKIVDLLTGKAEKQKDLTLAMTNLARYNMQSEIVGKIFEASKVFIELGTAQEETAHLRFLLTDLLAAEKTLLNRLKAGLATSDEAHALQKNIDMVEAEIAALDTKINDLTISLNRLRGLPQEKLISSIHPNLPWNAVFASVSSEQEQTMKDQLFADNSSDYRLHKAYAYREIEQKSVRLKKLKLLPQIDLTGLYLSDDGQFNPLYNLLPGSTMRTSAIQEGTNSVIGFNIPIIDTGKNPEEDILSSRLLKAQLYVDNQKEQSASELTTAVTKAKGLSRAIAEAEEYYQRTIAAKQSKASRPDLLPYQCVDERIEEHEARIKLLNLQKEYFKAEAHLRQLGVLAYDDYLVSENTGRAQLGPVESRLPSAVRENPTLEIKIPKTVRDITGPVPAVNKQDAPALLHPANLVYYGDGEGHMDIWIRGQTQVEEIPHSRGPSHTLDSHLTAFERILTGKGNTLNRIKTLDLFLNRYQHTPGFLPAVESIILTSSHNQVEVVDWLFTFLADRDIPFLVKVIYQAMSEEKFELVDRGFESLHDVFIDRPEVLADLHRENFVDMASNVQGAGFLPISPDAAEMVFVNYLLWDKGDSVSRERILRSDFWNCDQLQRIQMGLENCSVNDADVVKNSPLPEDVERLANLIQKEIERRVSEESALEVFNLGPFKFFEVFIWDADVYRRFRLQQGKEECELFLRTSPVWRNLDEYLPQRLLERNQRALGDLRIRNAGKAKPILFLHQISGSEDNRFSLAYFNGLLEGKEKYVRGSQKVSELARIFESNAYFAGLAFDRLTALPQGIVPILKVYLDSEDPEDGVSRLVESRIRPDDLDRIIATMQDAASCDIVRRALLKLYSRTGVELFLDKRLSTYSEFELHRVTDPRGTARIDAYIGARAAEDAANLMDEIMSLKWIWFAGKQRYTATAASFMNNLRVMINQSQSSDPGSVNAYVDDAGTRGDPEVPKFLFFTFGRDVLKGVAQWKDTFFDDIKTNDHDLPWWTWFRIDSILTGIGFSLFMSFLIYRVVRNTLLRRLDDATLEKNIYEGGMITDFLPLKEKKAYLDSKHKKLRFFRRREKSSSAISTPKEPVIRFININNANIVDKYKKPLQAWQEQIRLLYQSPDLDAENLLMCFNNILNHASQLISLTPYTPELIYNEDRRQILLNSEYRVVLDCFTHFGNNTLFLMRRYLADRRGNLTALERQELSCNVDSLAEDMAYVNSYLDFLQYRATLDKVMGYKYEDDRFIEILYSFVRSFLGYTTLLWFSKRRVRAELRPFLEKGDRIVPGLYPDVDAIVEESLTLLDDVIEYALPLVPFDSVAAREEHKSRSFMSRLRMLMIPGVALFFLIGSSIGMFQFALTELAVMAILLSLTIYWSPHIAVMQMPLSKKMTILRERLHKQLTKMLNSDTVLYSSRDVLGGFIALSLKKRFARMQEELDTDSPSVDMLVFIPESAEDKPQLEKLIVSWRGRFIRKDIPVSVLPVKSHGSGNLYLEALSFVNEKLEDWERKKVMFVFTGSHTACPESIEVALLNGYKLAGNGSSAGEPVHILVYARDAYLGLMYEFPSRSDILSYSTWVAMDDLAERSLLNTNSFIPARPDIQKNGLIQIGGYLDKLDIEQLVKDEEQTGFTNKILTYLRRLFNLDNAQVKQFPAFIGLIRFGPKVVQLMSSLARNMQQDYALREELYYLHLVGDMVNVLTQSPREIPKYLSKRLVRKDFKEHYGGIKKKDIVKCLQDFYSLILLEKRSCCPDLTVDAFIAHPLASEFIPLTSEENTAKFRDLLLQSGIYHRSSSSIVTQTTSHIPGGLDFSTTEEIVDFEKSPDLLPEIFNFPPQGLPAYGLQSFRGFKFEIIFPTALLGKKPEPDTFPTGVFP